MLFICKSICLFFQVTTVHQRQAAVFMGGGGTPEVLKGKNYLISDEPGLGGDMLMGLHRQSRQSGQQIMSGWDLSLGFACWLCGKLWDYSLSFTWQYYLLNQGEPSNQVPCHEQPDGKPQQHGNAAGKWRHADVSSAAATACRPAGSGQRRSRPELKQTSPGRIRWRHALILKVGPVSGIICNTAEYDYHSLQKEDKREWHESFNTDSMWLNVTIQLSMF